MTSKLGLHWLPCQAPGVNESVLGRVGPVSVYCDWVRGRVGSANFYLSVAARKIVRADPSLRYTSMLLGRQAATTAAQVGGQIGDSNAAGLTCYPGRRLVL